MKNLKKVLACLLVAAMTLTCFVGALTVSADGTGTIVAGKVEVASDATSVVVPVTINADAALNAAKITVAAEGYTVDDIAVASGDAYIDDEDVNGGTFLIQAKDNVAGFAAAVVNVTFAADAAVAADVVITLDEVHAATWAEEVVDLAITNGAITVKAPAPVGPVLDETLAQAVTQAIYIKETVGVDYTVVLPSEYDDIELVVTRKTFDSNFNFIDKDAFVFDKSNYNGDYAEWGYYYCTYTGVGMQEMNIEINATLYAFKDGVKVAYCDLPSNSVTDLAMANFTATKDDEVKFLMVDLLNMGTEAQKYFSKDASGNIKDCDLAKLDAPNAAADQNYASTIGDLTVAGENNTTALSALLLMGSSPSLSYTAIIDASYAKEDLTFTATYNDGLTGAVVDVSYLGTAPEVDSSWAEWGYYYFSFDKVAFYDGDKTVTAKVIYKAGTDEEVVVATNEYTVESYIAANIDSAAAGDILKSVAKFNVSAREYFINK